MLSLNVSDDVLQKEKHDYYLDTSTILSFYKHNVSRSESVSVIMCKGGKVLIQMGLLEEANLMAQMYGKLSSLHLMTEIDAVSETLCS
jgi:hypothetical protein